jgi:hypothetical protein
MIKKEFIIKLKNMIDNSSIHGIPNVIRTELKLTKYIWIFFLILSTSYCIYQIKETISSFLEFETTSKIKIESNLMIEFPMITICNKNAFTTPKGRDYFFKIIRENSFQDLNEATYIANAKLLLSNESKYEYYPSFENFVIGCRFSTKKCNYTDFDLDFNVDYGYCYKFNSGNKSKIKQVNQPGKYGGLVLTLNAESTNDNYSNTNGIHLIINHHKNLVTSYHGIDISSGTENNIILRRYNINQLPYPYSDCRTENEIDDSTLVKTLIRMNFSYRQLDCYDLCFQKHYIDKCGCYLLTYHQLNSNTPCMNTSCMHSAVKSYDKSVLDNCSLSCPRQCKHEKFSFSIYSINYPSQYDFNRLTKNSNESFNFEYYRDKLLKLNIYFEDLETVVISEISKTAPMDIFSNIGGTLGLFLG